MEHSYAATLFGFHDYLAAHGQSNASATVQLIKPQSVRAAALTVFFFMKRNAIKTNASAERGSLWRVIGERRAALGEETVK